MTEHGPGGEHMIRVFLGLMSQEGDRLGHLVRGVQMLRSYGKEASVIRYSDVADWTGHADEPPTLCCVLECMSEATAQALQGMARETEWALGDEPRVLRVKVLQYGTQESAQIPTPLRLILAGGSEPGLQVVIPRPEFAKLCDWGQQLTDSDSGVIGEWPSATGR